VRGPLQLIPHGTNLREANAQMTVSARLESVKTPRNTFTPACVTMAATEPRMTTTAEAMLASAMELLSLRAWSTLPNMPFEPNALMRM
jgi:hypothetical protein